MFVASTAGQAKDIELIKFVQKFKWTRRGQEPNVQPEPRTILWTFNGYCRVLKVKQIMEKDVILYSGFIVIHNRGRRKVRRFDQLTTSSENRLRAIAAKLRPVKKRQSAKSNCRPNRSHQSKRRPSAAEGLRLLTYSAMSNLVDRVNNTQEELS